MKILVTGGAGFIGSHIAEAFVGQGDLVVVLDDLSGGFVSNIPDGATFVQGSITDPVLVEQLFSLHQFDYVYHIAAYAAEGLSHFIRHYNYTNNVLGSINLINAAIKYEVKCFIFTSSMGVYGTQPVPYREGYKPAPEDPYGIAKYTIEQDLATAHAMFGLNYVIFRPHNVYGPRQNIWDKYRNVIGIFMNRMRKGEPLSVFGDGLQTRAFSYVGDIVPVLVAAANRPEMYQQIFNVGGDTPYTILELADAVRTVFGQLDYPIHHWPPRYEVTHAYSSHDKLRKYCELDQTSLTDGMKAMADWAKTVPDPENLWHRQPEIEKNLPEVWR